VYDRAVERTTIRLFYRHYSVVGLPLVFVSLLLASSCTKKKEPSPEPDRASFIRQQILEVPPTVPLGRCPYGPGDLPQKTLTNAPNGKNIAVDHFVFVVQENRSFDHYFQDYTPAPGTSVDVAPATYAALGRSHRHNPVKPFEMQHPCPDDPAHDYESVLLAWHGGKMDGFALAAGDDAVSYFSHNVLSYYHALARTFALSDRHFADFLGPTWPNRLYLLSGTSFAHTDNTAPPPRDIETSLFHQLDEKGISWLVYADSSVFEELMYPVLHRSHPNNFKSITQFVTDAKSGKLPAFAWVESSYGGVNATDEHPPANVEIGQQFVGRIVDATMRGADWKSSLLVLTYDEHGGFFDHVAPPTACLPDEHKAKVKPGHIPPRFDYLGMRVPLIIVSPWAKRGYVSHQTTSHASLLRLVQARFDLPALTRRDANSVAPFDMLDFNSPPRLDVPELPEPKIELSNRKNCEDAAIRDRTKNPKGILPSHGH
jgi:phospholipase C